MNAEMDPDRQPACRAFNRHRLEDRAIDELIGLCKGVLADGALVIEEAKFIADWMDRNRDIANLWPANILYARIQAALLDGKIDDNEEEELVEALMQVTGGPCLDALAPSGSTALPLDDPLPPVVFADREFCLTGKFVTGSRKRCESIVHERGGRTHSGVRRSTDFLVIGAIGSRDWIHSTHGRKIEKAVVYRDRHRGLRIISEQHWVSHL